MDRTEDSLKRQRISDDSDGDISLVSRSPSPSPDASMDVDPDGYVSKYDEYVQGAIREVITVDTKIKPTNKGFSMLAKMGWSEGQPLGLSGDGRIDPIPFEIKRDSTGLGKTSQDVRMIEETVSQRRGLDSERQTKETEDQRRAREDNVARKAAVQDEISSTLRAFYCALCDKQFKNVAQYDEHTNSYAHHHKARFRDMQANARLKPQEEIDKRKEKERKREEKELRKIAAASGIRMPKSLTPVASGSGGGSRVSSGLQAPLASTAPSSAMDLDSNTGSQGLQKKGGWASINPLPPSPAPSSGLKKSGWATVTSASTSSPPPPSDPPRSSGWVSVSPPSAPAVPPPPPAGPPTPDLRRLPDMGPTFRTGGWTSLDAGTTTQPESQFIAREPHRPSPSPLTGASSSTNQVPVGPPPPASGPVLAVPPKPIPGNPVDPAAQPVRSGWREFQAKNSKRR